MATVRNARCRAVVGLPLASVPATPLHAARRRAALGLLLASVPATPLGAVAQPTAGTLRSDTVPGTGVVMTLAYVPGGVFALGSPADQPGRDADEGPVRSVRLSPFWIGVHETTYEAFAPFRFRRLDDAAAASAELPYDVDAVSRPSPPYEDPAHGMGKEGHPAVGMTRLAALHFARWLSYKTGRLYRLPTEAEWEVACRAGGEGPFGVPAAALDAHAWTEANSGGVYHPVGDKEPNAWGLHDMHGNVAEWVLDSYRADAYAELPDGEPALDPVGGSPPRGRGVVRGGAFDDDPSRVRCAERYPESAAWKRRDPQMPRSRWWNTDAPHVGFRLVSPAAPVPPAEIRAYWEEMLGGA